MTKVMFTLEEYEKMLDQRDILQHRINRALHELTLVDGKRAAKARDILLGYS